ncbi:MAG: M20/M25/M40 family metallo-hydrolase [Clostridia bacterium]|nr:M20/M25/M40 family metallo-hydrolase [Clostridia bacterium]
MLEKLKETLDLIENKYIRIWEDICNIESPTWDKAGVDSVGKYCATLAESLGYKAEIKEIKTAGNIVIITMNQNAENQPFCISGHMDTVHEKGSFGTPAARISGGKLYAPGALDCKGGIVAGLYAMEAMKLLGYNDRPVMMLLESDEEDGSSSSNKETINYICDRAKDAIGFLNLEGFTTRDYCCIQRKGIITYKFTVTGIEAHSSECAKRGANAILDAAYKIAEIEKIKDDGGITCNTGTISGGSVPNTVAGSCEFKVNVRYKNADERKWIDEHLRSIAKTEHVKGCKCDIEIVTTRLAMEYTERNVSFLEKINSALIKSGYPTLKGAFRKGGSDAAEITSAGIPCIDSIGVSGGGIHSPNEFADIDSLKFSAGRIASIIMNFEK